MIKILRSAFPSPTAGDGNWSSAMPDMDGSPMTCVMDSAGGSSVDVLLVSPHVVRASPVLSFYNGAADE